MLIKWTPPYDNEQTILAYQILIADSTGTVYTEDTTNCDASVESIVNANECSIPMEVFKDENGPYNLDFRELIVAKARAYNIYGWQETFQ